MPSPLPLRLTLDELAHLAEPRPEVELHGLDMGWYIVRLHRDDSVSLLSTAQGDTQRFSGTQWVSRALAPLGFTHGTLTWAEAADEMIGHPTPPVSDQQRLQQGVRVAFATRH
ncbi:DUF6482 family protein [Vreelandella hamiltonii]|uniref:Uncharacterized protein n=2 Tax=Halomonadaceae TaxID=28256 RepID=A0A8H9LXL9_9GAMM|nr:MULTISPECIES: DUF6482 family protein [Halomonas]GGW37610.1 hypothetical protein GCM10007157_31060 [Halomonas hamiltonii]GGW61793.1 hypothetical protein GCM10007158_23360 [Halomonas johnsoniae]